MKHLILLRHAKSDWSSPCKNDFDRPLNRRGENDAPQMGKRLRQRGLDPERIISSPAKRARDTTRLLTRQLTILESGVIFKDAIYGADTGTLLEIIAELPENHDTVLLVGHNPGLQELVGVLTGHTLAKLPTCGAVGLELDLNSWSEIVPGCGRVRFFDFPKNPGPVSLS